MPITQHPQPVYTLTCENPDCRHDEGAESLLDPDGYPRYFDTERLAREWAETNGWSLHPMLCPPCAADTRDLADHPAAPVAPEGSSK